MTLSNRRGAGLSRKTKIPTAYKDPMSFGKDLRMSNKLYQSMDRNGKAFMRKVLLTRLNEADAMLKSKRYTTEEKKIIRSNRLALKNQWDLWNKEMVV